MEEGEDLGGGRDMGMGPDLEWEFGSGMKPDRARAH